MVLSRAEGQRLFSSVAELLRGEEQNRGLDDEQFREKAICLLLRLGVIAILSESNWKRPSIKETLFSGVEYDGIEFDNFEQIVDQLAQSLDRSSDKSSSNRSARESFSLSCAFQLIDLAEQLLDLKLAQTPRGWSVKNSLPERRKEGRYYTPAKLTAQTTKLALHRLLGQQKVSAAINTRATLKDEQILALRIVDPAMGAGAFLVSVLDLLISGRAEGSQSNFPWQVAQSCLYGVDLNPIAGEAAKLVLWLYCVLQSGFFVPFAGFLADHLKCGDSLLSCWSEYLVDLPEPSEPTKLQFDHFLAQWFHQGEELTLPHDVAIVEELAGRYRFFHWQLEFPSVFAGPNPGFDAVISNPPWEIAKPNAREFFSAAGDDYKAVGKAEAIARQKELCQRDQSCHQDWLRETSDYQLRSKFFRASGLLALSDNGGSCGADCSVPYRPYRAQGASDLNAYKLFLELGFALLKNEGCLAMVLPSGIYTDKGAAPLRQLLLTHGDVFAVRSFMNRDRAFNIHPSFNFCIFACQRGVLADVIEVSFGNRNAATLLEPAQPHISYQKKDVQLFSPRWRGLVEVEHAKDLEVLKKLYSNGVLLGSSDSRQSWHLEFRREFDLTNDSNLFLRRANAESDGFICDEFGNWLKGKWKPGSTCSTWPEPGMVRSHDGQAAIALEAISHVFLPLYEGRMLGQFDYSEKLYRSGSGRTAIWQTQRSFDSPDSSDSHAGRRARKKDLIGDLLKATRAIGPQYLLPLAKCAGRCPLDGLKTGYLAVGSPTNIRTMIAAPLYAVPCGNSVPVFIGQSDPVYSLGLSACLNSFVFDYVLRLRMSGNNVNYYLLEECPLPGKEAVFAVPFLMQAAAAISLGHPRFVGAWSKLRESTGYRLGLASDWQERTRLRCMIDCIVAHLFALDWEELAWILRQCDQSVDAHRALPLKGFWRVDKNLPPAHRRTNLTLLAYADLLEKGLERFIEQGCGAGWQMPVEKWPGQIDGQRGNITRVDIEETDNALKILENNLGALLQIGSYQRF